MLNAEYGNFSFDYIIFAFEHMKQFELFPLWYLMWILIL